MAHSTTSLNDRAGDRPEDLRKPHADERRSALALLLTGQPRADQPAVDHFMNFASQQGLSLDGLWAAYRDQSPAYATLIIPGIGRAAVLFTAPIQSPTRLALASNLIQAVVTAQDAEQVSLIQVLLEPTQALEEQALGRAGFTRLASLVYMRRSSRADATGGAPVQPCASIECDGKTLTAMTWQDDRYDAFARAIETSYLDTRDCPALVGVRRIDDIIAGHKAVGRFEPDMWSVYYQDDQPAAVMLLNRLIDRAELELVYLGLSPAFRGKGLAHRLMQHALALAHARSDTGIHLAVDQANKPAVKLYKGLGFRATGRKLAMIYVLK